MDLKYVVLTVELRKQNISIVYTSTQLMVADALTKTLPRKTFMKHVNRVLNLFKSFFMGPSP